MKQIERKMVASGIIGQFNHEWMVQELYDKKSSSKHYNLYVNEVYINSFNSIVSALSVLVEAFNED